MIGVIPAAGYGKRLRPFTFYRPKPLLGIAGKPVIQWAIDELKKLKVDDIIIVINPEYEEIFKKFLRNEYSFISQEIPLGLGHAVYRAIENIPEKEIVILLGDTILSFPDKEGQFILVKKVKNPENYGIVEIEGKKVKKVLEKPENPPSNLAIVGGYKFRSTTILKKAIKEIMNKNLKSKGEYQLTDAIQIMLNNGEEINYVEIDEFYDCGSPSLMLQSNKKLLKNKSIILSKNLKNSKIEENTYIEEDVVIKNSIIKDSIILTGAFIENSVLIESFVGENTKIKNFKGKFIGVGGIEGI